MLSDYMSSSQTVDLVFLYFILIFIFFFLTFLFLEHKIRVSDSHESQDIWNKKEGSRTNNIIQYGYHILTLCPTYSHLG